MITTLFFNIRFLQWIKISLKISMKAILSIGGSLYFSLKQLDIGCRFLFVQEYLSNLYSPGGSKNSLSAERNIIANYTAIVGSLEA